jgi:TonB family protein
MRSPSLMSILIFACAAVFTPTVAAQESGSQPSNNECTGPVYKGSEVSHRAAIASHPNPQITEAARSRGIKGRVVIAAVLCRSGLLTDIKVVEGLPFGLTEQAVEAARQTKFTPAEKEGQQVSQAIRFEFNFSYIGERRPLAKGPFEGRIVESIEMDDLPAGLQDGILARLETQLGEPYNREHLAHDWQLLLHLGNFDEKASTLRIEERISGDLGIVFELKRRPEQ